MSTYQYPAAVVDTSVLLATFRRKDNRHTDGVDAFTAAQIKIVSPLVLAELDYLLLTKVGEAAALEAVTRLRALAAPGIGQVRIAQVDAELLGEAERLLHQYKGHALGLTDAVNACLAWRMRKPVILTFDHHYRDVIAPVHPGTARMETVPPARGS